MTVDEFFAKYEGKGLDYDGSYGFQCVDVFKAYNKEVIGGPAVKGNAIDYWSNFPQSYYRQVKNTASNFPLIGDVVIWGTAVGQYGHIAICKEATKDAFTSFDQNWPVNVDVNGNGLGVCHFQPHNYNGLLGWLRPERIPDTPTAPVDPPVTVIINDQTKIDLGEKLGIMEVQAIRSAIIDLKKTVTDMATEEAGYKTQIEEMVKSRKTLADKLQCADDFAIITAEVRKLIEKEDQLNQVSPSPWDKFVSALVNAFKKKK
jgi:hypothetical protein